MTDPDFTIGIEEEYLIVDPETRDLVSDPPRALMEECGVVLGSQVGPEFLRAQIEVGTSVCESVVDVSADLTRLRKAVAEAASGYGFRIIAASTHPFAHWSEQLTTDKERYDMLARAMQTVLRRLVICGMHVHVGIGDPDLRIDLMNQVSYFLPHLLALSTSSPFWEGTDTGLKSYRQSIFRSVPRTGIPPTFASWGEYRRHVDVMVEPGLIEDATRLWWDVRPSDRYPTLEMRVSDICTRVGDGITIAAIYVCLLRMLYRMRLDNQRWREYAPMLIEENIWRAQRYGIDESLMDFGRGELVPYRELVDEIIDWIRPDAEAMDCVDEVENARDILTRGTSADRQLQVFAEARQQGADDKEALHAVVDFLIDETLVGIT